MSWGEHSLPLCDGDIGCCLPFTLNPGEWDFGNYGISNISDDPNEPVRRAFAALGYAYALYEKSSREADTLKILSSLQRGVPVLAFRVVGPSDCCIITGYDEGGEVLLGWSTYQDIPDDHNLTHDPSGYFRKPGWHENLGGYILIGAKLERPSRRAIYLDALKWAVQLMRTPKVHHKCTELEALRIWAEEMTQEKYFPPGDEDTLGLRYVSTTINLTMLRDHFCAEPFLKQVSEELPDLLPEISRAADCYAEVKHLTTEMLELINDNFSEKAMKAIKEPDIRQSFANLILDIRDQEEQAITFIESLLKRHEHR